jgi:uncharacterized protein
LNDLTKLIARAEALLEKIERIVPATPPEPNWKSAIAFRWRKKNNVGYLQTVTHPHKITLKDIHGVDEQKKRIELNTKQFVEGRTANNILLTGARGTGKSSLIKAVLNKFSKHGLRLIEVDKQELIDLPDIVDIISSRSERFVIFCDDLSFESNDPGYKALKVILDGSIAAPSENVLIYATSNRRHLMPEYMSENLEYKHVGEEVHPSETVEEKISLSERFGLWLSFYPFDQDDYLAIAEHWVKSLGASIPDANVLRQEALLWALTRSSRSGRVAHQFALDWAGRQKK